MTEAAKSTLADMALFPEMNPGPVIRTDDDGVILLVNAAARALFKSDHLPGRRWRDICPGVDADLWRSVIDGADLLNHESEIDGRTFVFVYRRPSHIPSVFIYGSDITQRKNAERLAALQAEQLAEMARFPDMNPGPVLRTDTEGVILLANTAARELFGESSLTGRSWLELFPLLGAESWRRITSTTEVTPVEGKVGGRSFVFAHRRSPDGRFVFIYGNDITLLRAAEDALRNAEKMAMLGTLAAGVAHELNNPAAAASRGANQLRDALGKLQDAFVPLSQLRLTADRTERLLELVRQDRDSSAMASHIDPLTRSDFESDVESWLESHDIPDSWELAPALVSLGYDSSELSRVADEWGDEGGPVIRWIARAQPVLALAREIEEATRRISDIVQALKTYSFLGEAPVRPVSVTEGIDNTLLIMRNKLKNGVTVHREYAPDLPAIEAHGSELNQVWTNIIDNAIDAMRGKGHLVVRARRDGTDVVIEFEDDGPGMPESVRQYIFDPFFTTKEPGRGTGLGLSTTRNVVEKKHGGSIEVVSRPGCTRFIIRLPVQQPRASEPADRPDAAATA